MSLTRMYGLFLRHFYLITRSFPRVLDLVYWPTIQITLWGFISNFFATHTTYYNIMYMPVIQNEPRKCKSLTKNLYCPVTRNTIYPYIQFPMP